MLVENLLPLTFLRNHDLVKDKDNFPGKYFAGVLRALNALVGQVRRRNVLGVVSSSLLWAVSYHFWSSWKLLLPF